MYKQAITHYIQLVNSQERVSDKAIISDALYELGMCYMNQDSVVQAKFYFDRLQEKFPGNKKLIYSAYLSIAEHYFLRTNDIPELTKIKGFFGIKLTSGELHILHGETVNEDGALTAKVLFDPTEIRRVHDLFELHARPTQELGIVITNISKHNQFQDYLNNLGISLRTS